MGEKQTSDLDPRVRLLVETLRIVIIQILCFIEDYLGFERSVKRIR